MPIYWLNSSILATDNSDLYDGSWANENQRTNQGGTTTSARFVWTGSTDDGRKDIHAMETTAALGASIALGAAGCGNDGQVGHGYVHPTGAGNPLDGSAFAS